MTDDATILHSAFSIVHSALLAGAAASFAAYLAMRHARRIARASDWLTHVPRPRLAAFLAFALAATLCAQKSGTNAPPQGVLSPRVVQAVQPGESGGEVTNLCFTGICVSSNAVALSLAWPTNLFADGACLDFFAKVGSLTNRWQWIGCADAMPASTNLDVAVPCDALAPAANAVLPAAAFFRASDRATSAATMADSDGDGIPDVYELHNGTNPYVPDAALVPKLTVGADGEYATVAAALAASTNYSVIAMSAGEHALSGSLVMPEHPVMLTGPEGGYAVLRSSADIAVVLLDGGQDSETIFRNVCLVLEREGGFQAGFWIGGNLPWSGLAASPTFENVRVRALYPDTLYYGWHYYRDDGGTSSLSGCTMNAAGATDVIGVYSYGGPDVAIADCRFVNFPTDGGSYATYFQDGTNVVAEHAAPEPGLSWAGYPLDGEYSATADSDGDGLSDRDEIFVADTDPWLADSDGDGVSDGDEMLDGTDPRVLGSYLRHVKVVTDAADGLAAVTNYVAWGVEAGGWETNGMVAAALCPATNEFTIAVSNAAVYAKAFRDLNRDGVYDADADILLSRAVASAATHEVRLAFGDVDSDGIPDVREREEGTDPYDAKSCCFSLSVVEHGVVRTTNYLSAAVMFGDAAVYGPVFATNRTFAADVGHLVATNGEPVVMYFWDDANSNGVRDVGEAFASRTIPVRGHENAVTNTFQTVAFDRDSDGILDWWEALHADAGLSATNAADARLDPDGDGLINLHEYWADCDPLTYDGTNTALSVMARSVDERIRGGDAELRKPKFVNYKSNAANGVFVANTNFWLYGVDTTCASPWQGNGNRHQWAATLITPRHIICATHLTSGVGTKYWFVGKSGTVYMRTTVSRKDINTPINRDISILMLNAELPSDDVTPAKLLPANYAAYIGKATGLPRICFDQEEKAVVQDVGSASFNILRHVMFINGISPRNETRAMFFEEAVSGDSGNPCFLLLNDQMVLTNTTWTGPEFGGTMLSDYADEIQFALDLLAPNGNYSLQFVNLEAYSVFNGGMP